MIQQHHNLEAERAVLGALVLEPSIIKKVSLTEEDFYMADHKKIFRAIIALDHEGIPPDLVTLSDRLTPEECIAISDYTNMVATAANFSYYEGILREQTQKRLLQKLCLWGIEELAHQSPDEIITKLRNETAKVIVESGSELVHSKELAREVWSFLERRSNNRDALSGIASGLKDLDRFMDGFQNGDLVILAGRPATGKSALGMHFARKASEAGHSVGFLSLEMGKQQLGIRSLSSLSETELWKLRKGLLSPDDWNKVTVASNRLADLPICFSFLARDSKAIAKSILQMVEIYRVEMVILDYLQLAKGEGVRETREREVAEISWRLKTLAQAHRIPVIALAQLNRDSERQGRKPIMSDLRESGALEQDADVVMLLSRSEANQNSGPIEINIAKGRNIGTGSITVYFDAEHMTFRDCDPVERNYG